MARSADIIVSAVTEYDGRALAKGSKQISSFDKSISKLAKKFASLYSITKIAQFGKASFNAFVADDKALKSLNQTLANTGNAFASGYVTDYIANLEKMSGVLDDSLRPAFQTLLTSTGSVIQSQKALDTALNVSMATGKDLTSVSQALAKGFAGNTAGLSRLGAGLDKATLKSGDMALIMGKLNEKFAGQAATFIDSYAGKMAKLNVAAANAKETIGKGLIDALTVLGKDHAIETVTDNIGKLAQAIADTISGITLLASKLDSLSGGTLGKLMGLVGYSISVSPLGLLANVGKNARVGATAGTAANSSMQDPKLAAYYTLLALQAKDKAKADREALAALKKKNALSKIENDAAMAKLKLSDDAAVLEKLRQKFDVERIGIQYALTQATDITTRKVLEGQMAILDGDAKKAAEINYSLDWLQKHREASEAALAAADAAVVAELAKLAAESSKTAASLGSLGSASADAAMAQADAALAIADLAMNAAVAMEQLFASQQSGIDAWLNKLSGAAGVPPTSAPDSGGSYFNLPNSPGARGQALAQDISTNISGYVMPVVLTDSAGFDAAINQALQDAARKGFSQAGSASSYY